MKKNLTKKTSTQSVAPKRAWYKRLLSWIWGKRWWVTILVVAVLGGFFIFGGSEDAKTQYALVNISRGDLRQVVTATGEIQPVNTVSVGSQVSGTIDNLYVDFNSTVSKGDVLLTIEPSVLQATVDESRASLDSAISQRDLAKSEYKRSKELFEADIIARSEMEQAENTYKQAEASVKRAQSTYDRAVTNLGYATITSPVNGTVISRKVDVGQTVAASFQTPDLFEIAEDLTKMQIETSVSEADIGVIADGQPVTFTVDAYPTETFEGIVRQIRLSPTVTSNVVVYTVVIDVDNTDLRLKPGMTAFVTIIISEKQNVWKAANSAFLVRTFNDLVDETLVNGATPKTHLALMRDGDVVLVPYEKGLSTATETEIISDEIQVGDKIITGRVGAKTMSSGNQMRMGNPMGGPRR